MNINENNSVSIKRVLIERWNIFSHQLFCIHIWDKTNSRKMMSNTMNKCVYCGKVKAGPDGWN